MIPILVNNRRSISPALAIILLAGLAVAGATATAVVYNYATNNPQSLTRNTEEIVNQQTPSQTGFGQSQLISGSSASSPISSEIVGMTSNSQTGSISSVQVTVTNNGNSTVYVNGAKVAYGTSSTSSDAQWTITSASGATMVNSNGNPYQNGDTFGGYAIPPGQTATFTITETSGNPVNQIPQDAANLVTVTVNVGDQPGVTTLSVATNEINLPDPFAPMTAKVALLYYPGRTRHSERTLERLLQSSFFSASGSTKNIEFQFNKRDDKYSLKKNINATKLAEDYDLVIFAMWAIPNGIASDVASTLYDNGVPMVFYGSIHKFRSSDINFTLTSEIVGLSQVSSIGDDADVSSFSQDNSYDVFAGLNLNYAGNEDDDEDESHHPKFDEIREEDLVNVSSATALAYANVKHDHNRYNVTVLAYKDGSSRVVSSPIDPHEADDDSRAIFHLALPRNMIFMALKQEHRLKEDGNLSFQELSFKKDRRHDHKVRPTITFTVKDGDINLIDNAVTFEFTVPSGISFSLEKKSKVRIQVESSAMTRTYVTTEKLKVDGNVISFSLKSDYHKGSKNGKRSLLYLFEGDNVTITFPVKSSHRYRWMELDSSVSLSTVYDWSISASWMNMDHNAGSASKTFSQAISPSSAASQPIIRDKY